jgi:hypothetical protein
MNNLKIKVLGPDKEFPTSIRVEGQYFENEASVLIDCTDRTLTDEECIYEASPALKGWASRIKRS